MSGAFGFGDDLAYFRGVLGEFARRMPRGRVLVREGYPVERYPELPLDGVLRFWVRHRDRAVDGFVYTGNLRVPTAMTFWLLLRRPTDVVVVVEFAPTALVTSIAAHLRRRKVVQLIESDPSFRGGTGGALARRIKRFFARRAHVVLVSNERGAAYVADGLGVSRERIIVGPYLTSEPAIDVAPATPPSAGEPVRFLFLNSLQKRKGLHLLLDAFARADRDAARPWQLDVVGDGPERANLESQAARLALSDRVRFHGAVAHDAVADHYAATHVVVCPTQGDYRSLAGFEAINCARPVVLSTRDGATEEILASGAAAVAVDPLDATRFAAALGAFLADDDRLPRALAHAAERPDEFRLEAVGANLETAILTAVSR